MSKSKSRIVSITSSSNNKLKHYYDVLTACELFVCGTDGSSNHNFYDAISSTSDMVKNVQELASCLELDIVGVCIAPSTPSKWGPIFIHSALQIVELILKSQTPDRIAVNISQFVILRYILNVKIIVFFINIFIIILYSNYLFIRFY